MLRRSPEFPHGKRRDFPGKIRPGRDILRHVRAMKTLILLILATFTVPLSAALSPTPVVVIESVNLPKVSIRISNPSKTEECRIWDAGISWEEQNKWFSLRPAGGGPVIELHPKIQSYTVNYPRKKVIPAGASVTFSYDLSDKGEWALPKDFKPGQWQFDIQAHLQIPRDVKAHKHGIFIGHVTTGWHDANGHALEAVGKSVRDEKHAAIETRKGFPLHPLTALLEKWNTGTLPDKQSLGDFFGSDFPWENLECVHEDYSSFAVLLPGQAVLSFQFHIELPDAYEIVDLSQTYSDRKGLTKVLNATWLPAKDTLQTTPARQLRNITLTQLPARQPLFARAFDRQGRFDKEATGYLW